MSEIITRFAPSPTGALHLGGARTALFNFLFARHHQGRFRLRIEDTDKARSSEGYTQDIREGLDWLGLNWDGEIIYQSARRERHREIAEQLVADGHAYRCDCSPEALEARRAAARAEGGPLRYDGKCRERDVSADRPFTIRIKSPRGGKILIPDAVQGEISFAREEMDDFILLRSDGSPTYMLCVVVDDHDMGITHIIRGVDHLTNAARQEMIYDALGWQNPVFAHIPLIHGSDGAKLSKRHGAASITEYREGGYLAAAMRNYLVRLGWAHGDDEIFSDQQAISWFSLEGIGKSAARLDAAKLDHLNAHYMRQTPPDELLNHIFNLLNIETKKEYQRFIPILPSIAQRSVTLTALAQNARFLFIKAPELTASAKTLLADEDLMRLKRLSPHLERIKWEKSALEQAIRAFAVDQNCPLKDIAQPLRIALTGQKTSPGIFDVIEILGQNETLDRLKRIGK